MSNNKLHFRINYLKKHHKSKTKFKINKAHTFEVSHWIYLEEFYLEFFEYHRLPDKVFTVLYFILSLYTVHVCESHVHPPGLKLLIDNS